MNYYKCIGTGGGGGGVSDYTALSNKPQINSVTLTGNQSTADLGLFDGDYANLTNKPTIPDELADLTADATHRVVTDTQISTWNGKSDFSGDYDDLTDKPQINSVTLAGNKTTAQLIPLGTGLFINANGELEAAGGSGGGSNIKLTTTESTYYSTTVTIAGSNTSQTATFSASGVATFSGFMDTGTITVTFSDSSTTTVSVPYFGNYEFAVNSIPFYERWVESSGASAAGYSSLADVLADETMLRRLFTVHASVDFLVDNASDADVSTIIADDYCAKWINLRDYALDTLYANATIATLMDTADKYFYGEWVNNNGTWEAKGNVPIMTSNSAPYGSVVYSSQSNNYQAYRVFDDSAVEWDGQGATNQYIGYAFTNPVCVKMVRLRNANTTTNNPKDCKIQWSNDNSTWTDIVDGSFENSNVANGVTTKTIDNDIYALYWRVFISNIHSGTNYIYLQRLQFYGRELSVSVPTMTSNTAPYGEASASSNASQAYKAFDNNTSTWWYDNVTSGDLYYSFTKEFKFIKACVDNINGNDPSSGTVYLQCSDDRVTWTNISDDTVTLASHLQKSWFITNESGYDTHKYYRFHIIGGSNNLIIESANVYGLDYSEREFATGSTMKYLYDHGVELETITTSGTVTKGNDFLTLGAASSSAYAAIDTTSYSALVGYVGANGSGTNRLMCGASYSAFSATNMPRGNGIDISSVNGTNNTGVDQSATGTCDITEIYLI